MLKPKILLINPKVCSPRSLRLPLSLLHLAAVLEARFEYQIIDGNRDPDVVTTAQKALAGGGPALIGMTVMPGPQVAPAIEIASRLRKSNRDVPIVWGGYFPTLYSDAAINAPYVDFVVRGQGEATLLELLDHLSAVGPPNLFAYATLSGELSGIRGLTWKDADGIHHNTERPFVPPDELPQLPYDRLDAVVPYLRPSFMGTRTAVHQVAIGCRYHCSFCGVVSMFNGHTRMQSPAMVLQALTTLRDQYGATSTQFYDNNFFDREATTVPLLEALARVEMPYWCFARADTLANYSASTWNLIRKSKLRMAYIGAEASSDAMLKSMKKGTRVEHTLEAARRCGENGVVPEFSFILGGPNDPEGEIENTFQFVRKLKTVQPECEIILYFYSPTPQRDPAFSTLAENGPNRPMLRNYGPDESSLPTTPEEWAQPEWVNYVSHLDAPWLTERTRRRVKDFARVLSCRFPTSQDIRTPRWGKAVLRGLSGWRYSREQYDNPRELAFARRLIPLREPQAESL